MKVTLSLLSVLLCLTVAGQEVGTSSANPPNIKWMQLENENSTIIYPAGLKKEASRMAETLDFIDKNKRQSIGDKEMKLPMVLHGQSMTPNGFVSSAPFRSEIYPTPIANWNVLGANDWLDALAVHEYRHALQISNANVGITKLLRIITGRYGAQGSMLFTFPSWFAEGDAVVTETIQTNSGRGRMPSFSSEQRAIFYSHKPYGYMKARNGSYKTQLPSAYPFGYIQNLYARKKFGNNIWANILKDANRYKSPFYPFSGAIKKNTGLPARKLYKASYLDFEQSVNENLANTELIPFDTLVAPHKKQVIHYTFPWLMANGEIIARKSSYKETPVLIKINQDGLESKLTTIGHSYNSYISYNDNGALWLEVQPNPRWSNVDAARVVYYDFDSNKKKYLLEGKRVFHAALAPTGNEFLTVEYGTDLAYTFHKYDFKSGIETGSLSNDENWAIANLLYDTNGRFVYYTAKRDSEIALIKHDLQSNERILLTSWRSHVIVEPAQNDSHIYFRADFSGIDNIYAVAKNGENRISKITSVPVGAGHPAILGEDLVFSNFTSTGHHLALGSSEVKLKQEMIIKSPLEMEVYEGINGLEENGTILSSIPEKDYRSKPYKGFFRGWKFHSWGILPTAGSSEVGSVGSTLASAEFFVAMDDILGANSLLATYTRYINEEENGYGLNYEMGKFLPKLNIGYEYRGRNVAAGPGNRTLSFNEQEALIGLSIPLRMIKGNFTYETEAALNWKGIQQFWNSDFLEFDNSKFGLYEMAASFDIQRRTAYQNIQSRLGGGASVLYGKSFKSGIANRTKLSAQVYLPGLGKNHAIEIQQAFQKEPVANTYQNLDLFSYARGYPSFFNETVNRTSINYHLPLLYPDFGIHGSTFIKRLKANVFFDALRLDDSERSLNLKSAGVEFRFDQKLFNLIDIPLGFRVGYRFKNDLEYIISIPPVFIDVSPVFIDVLVGD